MRKRKNYDNEEWRFAMRKGLFGGMFDFNRDGKIDSIERAAEIAFLNDMMNQEENDSSYDDGDIDDDF